MDSATDVAFVVRNEGIPDRETEPVYLTPKICRFCRAWYLSPRGARWQGCKTCCPTLEDRPQDPVNTFDADGYPTNSHALPHDGIPF